MDCFGSDIKYDFLALPPASNTLVCLRRLVQARKAAPPAARGADQLAPTIGAGSDVLLVNCTSIIEARCYQQLLTQHRNRGSTLTMLLAAQAPAAAAEAGAAPVPHDADDVYDAVGLDEDTGRLLHFEAGVDVEREIAVPRTVLSSALSGGRVSLHTDYKDVRAYVLSREVLDYVRRSKKADVTSFGCDVLPFLVRCQFFPEDAARLPNAARRAAEARRAAREAEELAARDRLAYVQLDPCDPHSSGCGSGSSGSRCATAGASMGASVGTSTSPVSCYAVVVDTQNVTCLRANTLQQYMAANRLIASGRASIKPWEAPDKNRFISASARISPRTAVGPECVVGDSTDIGDQCAVRKSVIGRNCLVHAGAKITNSVLMDGVVVMDRAVVADSILCAGVHVDAGVAVKDSQLGAGFCASDDLSHEAVVKE